MHNRILSLYKTFSNKPKKQNITKMRTGKLLMGILLSVSTISCFNDKKTAQNIITLNKDSIIILNEFKNYLDSCSVMGSIVIYDNPNQKWILSDTVEVKNETLPASTFKIINLLIALETKTIADENELIKWVGKTDSLKYGYRPEIYRDMTVREAFEVSAGWVFIELAKKIGKKNYEKYLTICNYGNLDLSESDDDFWNFGHFAISPINQVTFLKNLYEEKLPFSKRNIEIVKRVMVHEKNEYFTIASKTGWTRENNINTGWWIGYVENKIGVYFFATRLLQDRRYKRDDFGSCRKDITKKVFKDLNIIE